MPWNDHYEKTLLVVLTALYASTALASNSTINLESSEAFAAEFTHPENEYYSDIWQTQVVTNVAQPTLEVFLPEESKRTDTAVIIAPGGGLYAHSIESEGRDVARWLVSKGITAFVLKYRLVPTGEDGVAQIGQEWSSDYQIVLGKVDKVLPLSIQDGLNAIKHVRTNANKYGVNPEKIGFVGFSAGGAVTLGVSYGYDASSRPSFIVPVYPWTDAIKLQTPNVDAPPMIIICASDDELGLAKGAIELYESYFDAGKNVALHMYSKGKHGFGMKQQGLPSDQWLERVYEWMIAEQWVSAVNK